MSDKSSKEQATDSKTPVKGPEDSGQAPSKQKELGGRSGPEPTRYGDWEKNGIISDF